MQCLLKNIVFWQRYLKILVCCGQMLQHLIGYREDIRGQRPPQFNVTKGHNIWKVTVVRIPGTPVPFTACLTQNIYHMLATLALTNYGGLPLTSQTLWVLITTHCGDRKSRWDDRHAQSDGNILNIRFLPFKKKWMIDLSQFFCRPW